MLGYGTTGLLVFGIECLLRQPVRNHLWFWPGLGWFILLLLAQPLWAALRVLPRWVEAPRDVPQELYYTATRVALQKAVPDSALYPVGPDESGCKHFYFLHKRGFGLNTPKQSSSKTKHGQPYVADCIMRSARYLYLSDSTLLTHPRLAPYLGRRIARVGTIQALELQPAQTAKP